MFVYLLSHTYSVGVDKNNEEDRIIGMYLNRKSAKRTLLEYLHKKGFESHIDGFCIEKWEVDNEFQWEEGFRIIGQA